MRLFNRKESAMIRPLAIVLAIVISGLLTTATTTTVFATHATRVIA